MSSKQHIILGYPNSGKTTFLAALWHILDVGEAKSLTLEKIVGDVSYLNEIKMSWLKCEQVSRTMTSREETVEMLVRSAGNNMISTLRLPDFSGETFQKIFSDRECDVEILANFQSSGGIIFFINADRENDTLSVLDHDFPEDEETTVENDDTPATDFSPSEVPEQIRIIDILQILQAAPFSLGLRRLVIAVSAWDVVFSDGVKPEDWIVREMPMLMQYLTNNTNVYDVQFCGISAQGGKFEGEMRDKLLRESPEARVVCEWNGKRGADITQPLTWLNEDD